MMRSAETFHICNLCKAPPSAPAAHNNTRVSDPARSPVRAVNLVPVSVKDSPGFASTRLGVALMDRFGMTECGFALSTRGMLKEIGLEALQTAAGIARSLGENAAPLQ